MGKIIFTLLFLAASIPVFANIGYKNFILGIERRNAEKIIKSEYPDTDYKINYKAVVDKDTNIIEIKNKKEAGSYICLFFNEKNILYNIIVYAGYMNEHEYNGLIKNMIQKYQAPYRQVPDFTKAGYVLVSWYFYNRYIITCDIISTVGEFDNVIMISYKDKKLDEQYQLYLYKYNEY